MAIYHITGENLKKLEPLYLGWEETMIWSVLQGEMGSAWADSLTEPRSARLAIADFSFLAGEPAGELAEFWPEEAASGFTIMVPENEAWSEEIRRIYGENAKQIVRYAIKKEPDIFDRDKLRKMAAALPAGYELRMMDEAVYRMARAEKWSEDLCSQFPDWETYRKRGLGTAVLHDGILVAGVSSYTVYLGGIEIEIDTKEEHRRKGLALAGAARLILECLDRGLYPGWDAQNRGSLALAEKLGYHFEREYTAFEVYRPQRVTVHR
ncbi:GNAT family N-acetyltransferase [[Clostridium] symbiosum]|uniref:GNAT family N-acetyltransferase n=1 Tax=Clostridium symbiosum TaxID=1512 RepID=UPI001D05EA8B|nr:GNAT family N-acetyltransferase [[Clostridium] symbiosum]MCB6609036.1 GNAT family N-acetyltransferase [[Clostridium] symbiosum]MCB6930461.1 GNAT family N-acetyltransferase [[Clostridium] symbiosum]